MIPKTAEDAFRAVVLAVALGVLVGRWVDLYFMILPPLGRGPMPIFGVVEVSLAMGGVGCFFLWCLTRGAKHCAFSSKIRTWGEPFTCGKVQRLPSVL